MVNMDKELLGNIFTAADNHSDAPGNLNNTVGDLQEIIRRAFAILTVSQKKTLLNSVEVENLVEAGADDEFTVDDMLKHVDASILQMELALDRAGVTLYHDCTGWYYEFEGSAGDELTNRDDCLEAAYTKFIVEK